MTHLTPVHQLKWDNHRATGWTKKVFKVDEHRTTLCIAETDEEDPTLLPSSLNIQEKLVSESHSSMFPHLSYFSDQVDDGETLKHATAAGRWLQVKEFLQGKWTFGGFDISKDFCIFLLQNFLFYLDGGKSLRIAIDLKIRSKLIRKI